MAHSKIFWLGVLPKLFLDGLLILVFLVQAFVGGCLFFRGYVPIPANWANRLIAHETPEGLDLQVQTVRFYGNQIFCSDLELQVSEIKQTIVSAKSVELSFDWTGGIWRPQLREISLADGVLYTPSIYAPSGQHTLLLERIALSLKLDGSGWRMDRFAALHEDIRIWGSLSQPFRHAPASTTTEESLGQFYSLANRLTARNHHIDYFETPTIIFGVHSSNEGIYTLSLRANSPRLNHPEIKAQKMQLAGTVFWDGTEFHASQGARFSAAAIAAPSYDLEALDATLKISAAELTEALNGKWPQFQMAASRLVLPHSKIDGPLLKLDARQFPEVGFGGSAGGLRGAISFNGRIHTQEWSGSIHARGNLDFGEVLLQNILDKLPELRFHKLPDYNLRFEFGKGFQLRNAQIEARMEKLEIGNLRFDQLHLNGGYAEGRYFIDQLHMERGSQWLDLTFELDETNHDYRASLVGSAVPSDYNALLPSWWGGIFKDFEFNSTTKSHGDFTIHGNTKEKLADLYFGRAKAKNIAYRGVWLDQAALIVRGRGPYTELHNLEAFSGKGWARGEIAFASKDDRIKGPASVRIDLEAQLPLQDASRLFEDPTATLIGDFKTEALPKIHLEAALFNAAYPAYKGKSHFTLQADCPEPLSYLDIPFEHLAFVLYGRSNTVHLRDLEFGYANGRGSALIDIITPPDQPAQLRYKLALTDAEQNLALANLPQFGDIQESLKPEVVETADVENPDEARPRIDLNLHGEGPADDIWGHRGYGLFEIRNDRLATIQLLGPLSKLLQNTELNFTSFNLDTMHGAFSFIHDLAEFDPLQIDGLRTQIRAPGALNIRDQSIDMRVSVFLLGNAGNPDSRLRQIGNLLKRSIPNLLEFELSGTLQEQRFQSVYDPRNLIPNL